MNSKNFNIKSIQFMYEKEKEIKYKIMNLGGAMRETDNKINERSTSKFSVSSNSLNIN
jgi:hypothetical protein